MNGPKRRRHFVVIRAPAPAGGRLCPRRDDTAAHELRRVIYAVDKLGRLFVFSRTAGHPRSGFVQK